jgi:hypothetical protein
MPFGYAQGANIALNQKRGLPFDKVEGPLRSGRGRGRRGLSVAEALGFNEVFHSVFVAGFGATGGFFSGEAGEVLGAERRPERAF